MKLFKVIFTYTSIIFFTQIFSPSIGHAQTKTVYKEQFKKNTLAKKWKVINGTWTVKNDNLYGTSDREWAIMLCKKSLPDNYILSFSTLTDPKAYLFEVITNLNDNKFLGILLNQLENRIAIEDREFFPKGNNMGSYIHTKGYIGKLPKVAKASEAIWQHWKIQKTGNQLFIWINDEAIISFRDTHGIVKSKGKFGFAINGTSIIKFIELVKTKGDNSLPPADFKGRPLIKPTWSFSE